MKLEQVQELVKESGLEVEVKKFSGTRQFYFESFCVKHPEVVKSCLQKVFNGLLMLKICKAKRILNSIEFVFVVFELSEK